MRKIGVDWKIVGFDSTIAPAEMGKQDYELWTVTCLPLGGRPDEHLLRLEEHPNAEPDELERHRNRRVAERWPRRAERQPTAR